jgi:hypothetical protein
MSKRVNNMKGKKYNRRGIRAYRIGVEQLGAWRRAKAAAEPGWFMRLFGRGARLDLRTGSRSVVRGWSCRRHQLPVGGLSEAEIMDWRAKRGDRAAIRRLAKAQP